MSQLAPYPSQLGIFPAYMARQTETLVLNEKGLALTKDNYNITNLNGQPVLTVKAQSFSFSKRKMVMDLNANTLFTIRKDFGFGRAGYYCEDPSGQVFLEVKGKFSCR